MRVEGLTVHQKHVTDESEVVSASVENVFDSCLEVDVTDVALDQAIHEVRGRFLPCDGKEPRRQGREVYAGTSVRFLERAIMARKRVMRAGSVVTLRTCTGVGFRK